MARMRTADPTAIMPSTRAYAAINAVSAMTVAPGHIRTSTPKMTATMPRSRNSSQREWAGTGEGNAHRDDRERHRVLITLVVIEEAVLQVHAHAGHRHHRDNHCRGERCRETEGEEQPANRLREPREQRVTLAGHEAELLQEAAGAGQTVAAEPAEQLLGAVRGQRQAGTQAQNQNADTHVVTS